MCLDKNAGGCATLNSIILKNMSFSMNGVKEAGNNSGEGLWSSRCPTEQQGGLGRHRTTAKGSRRGKWSQEVNHL